MLAADKLMPARRSVRDVAAVAARRALRATAGGRRSRQAEARVLLRRSASAVQRRAEGAAGEDRAGRAAHPLQGRRRVLRDAESARRARCRARPARQPRAARAARVHAARPEGRAVRRRETFRAESRISTSSRRSPSSAWARRWCRCSTTRAGRAWSSAPRSARRGATSGRSAPTSGLRSSRARRSAATTSRPSIENPPTRSSRVARKRRRRPVRARVRRAAAGACFETCSSGPRDPAAGTTKA